ncbi:radical SAM protein [Desulfocurvibacter africanus]|uniref:Radical SAM domain protein n=1 Tax=Desulfocurvibacter africanus subsp. africanus str. Walvis Bay TaxID=690850 RepID=F3YY34_DESAF|nr:radical SAM protein [Desulfocurvibacter africanus]EGJ51810.1 Radical SAM domain protein [Desulfocurvibacter africanus subsp. africanus str. Walvis Bay]
MLRYDIENTVAVHVTRACNLACWLCYQRSVPSGRSHMIPERVHPAIKWLGLPNVTIYGGEPLTRPELVRGLLRAFPDKGYILHTNGTLPLEQNRDILDRVDVLLLTVESFELEKQPPSRRLSRVQLGNLLEHIEAYGDKCRIVHNIYPAGNDESFYDTAERIGLPVDTYPMVSAGEYSDMPEWLFRKMGTFDAPVSKPKLRLLEDGTLTRDMRGVYNNPDVPLPCSQKCQECLYKRRCPFLMFPHFAHDIIAEMGSAAPWFCRVTERFTQETARNA